MNKRSRSLGDALVVLPWPGVGNLNPAPTRRQAQPGGSVT